MRAARAHRRRPRRLGLAHGAADAVPPLGSAGGVRPDAEPRGRVLLASRDARFVKLTRFLLDGKGIEAETSVQADDLASTLELEPRVDAVILDAQDAVAEALVTANSARALRPEVPILIVGETRAAERAPAGVRIYDKWNGTDELLSAIEQILGERHDRAAAGGRQR